MTYVPSCRFDEIAAELRRWFIGHWKETYDNVPVYLENEDVRVPSPPSPRVGPAGSWLRFLVHYDRAEHADIGEIRTRVRTWGTVIVQIHTPLRMGPSIAEELCEDAAGIFRGRSKDFNGLLFRAPWPMAPTTDEFYRMDLLVPFVADGTLN